MPTFLKKYDRKLLIVICILTIWGFINFYGISSPLSVKNFGDQYKYIFEFFVKNILFGTIGFILFSSLNWKSLKRMSFPLFIVFFLFAILSFLPGLRLAGQPTARWIDLKIFSFQPTEFLKLTMLLWLAFFIPKLQKEFKIPFERSLILILILGVVSAIIYLQPTFSNLLIIWASIGIGYFSLKPKIKELAPFIFLIIFFIVMALNPLWEYRIQRILDFINKDAPSGTNFQKEQSQLAIGSGGIFGKGIGNSKVKYIGLPLIINDSVFAIIAEETGFVGSVILIGIFIILILIIIQKTIIESNPEKKFFAFGVATWISIQAFIHIASNVGIIPTTGIPLPFFSHGFSSQLAIMCALGIINNLKNS